MVLGWWESAPVFVILLALLPMFAWDTIKLSHRFAGPMFRFHDTVKRLANGERVPPIRLRKGDFWKDFAEDFNRLMQRMEAKQNHDEKPDSDKEPILAGCPDENDFSA